MSHTAADGPAIAARDVHRHFGAVRAVDGMNLTVPHGEVLALLGPNGAGKTSLLDTVLGFARPDAGTVSVCGTSPETAVRDGRVGAVLQTGGLLSDLSVRETLEMVAACHRAHVPVAEVMARADLDRIARRKVKKCSGGEQQRVRFGLALLTDPELLVLDEPTAGMDVTARRRFWSTMHAEAERGRTIVFATHYLPEAEEFADRIVLMHRGRVHADGTPDALREREGVHLSVVPTVETTPSRLAERLGLAWDDVECRDGRLAIRVRAGDGLSAGARADAVARTLLVDGLGQDLEITRASLDDVFLALTDQTRTAEPTPEEAAA